MAAISENSTSVRVRKLEPWVIQTHYKLAQNEGISLEAYLRTLLEKQALQAQYDMADELDIVRAEIIEEYGTNFSDSVEVVRAVREKAIQEEVDG